MLVSANGNPDAIGELRFGQPLDNDVIGSQCSPDRGHHIAWEADEYEVGVRPVDGDAIEHGQCRGNQVWVCINRPTYPSTMVGIIQSRQCRYLGRTRIAQIASGTTAKARQLIPGNGI